MNEHSKRFASAHRQVENTRAYPGGLVSFLITSAATEGSFTLFEAEMRPGAEPPLHMHEERSVTFYVLQGEIEVTCGDENRSAPAGTAVFLASRVPHTYRVRSETARFLVLMQPSLGIEGYFEALSQPASSLELPEEGSTPPPALEVVLEVATRHGVKFLGAPS